NPRRPAWEAGILPLNYARKATVRQEKEYPSRPAATSLGEHLGSGRAWQFFRAGGEIDGIHAGVKRMFGFGNSHHSWACLELLPCPMLVKMPVQSCHGLFAPLR
ncbi:MAG: hypothetical protein ACP5QA_10315, partial [Phycisphaerae bacterium]